ncbi:MAG: hypothetical protein ACRDDX_00895 [Cellulosilyticaceae bacterium]
MSFWIPVCFMYITFVVGLLLYKGRFSTAKVYKYLHYLYFPLFLLTVILYLLWGILRN